MKHVSLASVENANDGEKARLLAYLHVALTDECIMERWSPEVWITDTIVEDEELLGGVLAWISLGKSLETLDPRVTEWCKHIYEGGVRVLLEPVMAHVAKRQDE
jgi:hypothetical protein